MPGQPTRSLKHLFYLWVRSVNDICLPSLPETTPLGTPPLRWFTMNVRGQSSPSTFSGFQSRPQSFAQGNDGHSEGVHPTDGWPGQWTQGDGSQLLSRSA